MRTGIRNWWRTRSTQQAWQFWIIASEVFKLNRQIGCLERWFTRLSLHGHLVILRPIHFEKTRTARSRFCKRKQLQCAMEPCCTIEKTKFCWSHTPHTLQSTWMLNLWLFHSKIKHVHLLVILWTTLPPPGIHSFGALQDPPWPYIYRSLKNFNAYNLPVFNCC